MVFSSAVFLFAFMPLFFAGYFIVPGRAAKNVWLLLASLVFYAWGEPVYVALMVASIAANWTLGLAIGEPPEGGAGTSRRKALLVVAVVFNVAALRFSSAVYIKPSFQTSPLVRNYVSIPNVDFSIDEYKNSPSWV